MVNHAKKSIDELNQRLPELLWQMKSIKRIIPRSHLPAGLFKNTSSEPEAYIEDIQADIERIRVQTAPKVIHYMVEQVARKIDVLVNCCKKKPSPHSKSSKSRLSVQAISTRQQWLQDIEKEVFSLQQQEQALRKQLNTCARSDAKILSLQAELGDIQRQLTLSNEALKKARGSH